MISLKPCPCGGEAGTYFRDECFVAECNKCLLQTKPTDSRQKAAEEWNDHPMHQRMSGTYSYFCPICKTMGPENVPCLMCSKNSEITWMRGSLAYIMQKVGPDCSCYKEENVNYCEPCVYHAAKDALEWK